MYFYIFFCRIYDFLRNIYYYCFGDKMNYLEISIILSKMINKTKKVNELLIIEGLKKGLAIDKTTK